MVWTKYECFVCLKGIFESGEISELNFSLPGLKLHAVYLCVSGYSVRRLLKDGLLSNIFVMFQVSFT